MFLKRVEDLKKLLLSCKATKNKKGIDLEEGIKNSQELIYQTSKNGKIYVIGNGGSSGIASHFVNDLIKRLK